MKSDFKKSFTYTERVISSVLLIFVVFWMLTSWFGGPRDVHEVMGIIILQNPVTVVSLILILFGIWYDFKIGINKFSIYLGFLGLISMEIWYFLTWHLKDLGSLSITNSLDLVFPEFYIGFGATILLILLTTIFIKTK